MLGDYQRFNLLFIIDQVNVTCLQIELEAYIKYINTYNNEELLEHQFLETTILKIKINK